MMMANLPPVMLPPLTDYGMLTPTLGIKVSRDHPDFDWQPKLWWPSYESGRTSKTEARHHQQQSERGWPAEERGGRFFWRLQSLAARGGGLFVPSTVDGAKCWLAETLGADEARSSITTYFHSYPFVPGGAVSLPPPLLNSINNAAAAAITPGLVGHLFAGQQACNIGCSCTCTSLGNCNPHHHQQHHHHQQQQQHHHHQQQQHHHRPIAATTVLLQPVEHIKDTMVSARTNFLSLLYLLLLAP
ncbi:unnamed protein product [Xylocopa violacea]|uniref:Uncharacterized protein n=1 Tax=Xylocopa violacea TaxID=135666 RepID=A0ABP1NQ40_XYLVO